MKSSPFALSLVLLTLGFAPPASATEQVASAAAIAAEKAEAATDCSKQTWPNFTPSCLRNANSAVEVRLITATRR